MCGIRINPKFGAPAMQHHTLTPCIWMAVMCWSVVRLIAVREIRDQSSRDRAHLVSDFGLADPHVPAVCRGRHPLCHRAQRAAARNWRRRDAGTCRNRNRTLTPVLGRAGGNGAPDAGVPDRFWPKTGSFRPRYAADSPDSAPMVVKPLATTDEDALRELLASRKSGRGRRGGCRHRGQAGTRRASGDGGCWVRDGEENSEAGRAAARHRLAFALGGRTM